MNINSDLLINNLLTIQGVYYFLKQDTKYFKKHAGSSKDFQTESDKNQRDSFNMEPVCRRKMRLHP